MPASPQWRHRVRGLLFLCPRPSHSSRRFSGERGGPIIVFSLGSSFGTYPSSSRRLSGACSIIIVGQKPKQPKWSGNSPAEEQDKISIWVGLKHPFWS